MSRRWLAGGLLALALASLLLAWWGWHRGGLALLQVGLGACG